MPTRVLICLLALLGVALLPGGSVAAERTPTESLCCKVTYRDGSATVAGSIRLPAGSTLVYVGMDPPVGACTTQGTQGLVRVSKTLRLKKTVRGYYRFVYMFRHDGELVNRKTPRVYVKGKLAG